jgi:hypothetical protein
MVASSNPTSRSVTRAEAVPLCHTVRLFEQKSWAIPIFLCSHQSATPRRERPEMNTEIGIWQEMITGMLFFFAARRW